MLLYAVVLLLLVNVSSSHSGCCEGEAVSKSLLDTASDLISKAKSSIPSCSGNKSTGNDGSGNEGTGNDGSGNDSSINEDCPKQYLDCADWYQSGYSKSGIYNITLVNRLLYKKIFQVYCDMETDGGGWTVIQRRGNFKTPIDYFFKDWKTYKEGFGNIEEEFWLGNDKMYALTNQKAYSVRFDLRNMKLEKRFAQYDAFWIDDEFHNYTLHISGYKGDAGDSMKFHNEDRFSTRDRDNDKWSGNCAESHSSGWWFHHCRNVNLNGLNKRGSQEGNNGITWLEFTAYNSSLESTEIKIRPKKQLF